MSIAIFGFGCVAQGLYKVLKHSNFVGNLYVWRRKSKECAFLSCEESEHVPFVELENCLDLLEYKDVSVVVELMGGKDGIAFEVVRRALLKGMKVVTANKAMLAYHVDEFAHILNTVDGSGLLFEGAVCGGMPILSTLNLYHCSNKDTISSIEGILNGSTNYLLSQLTTQVETQTDTETASLKENTREGDGRQGVSVSRIIRGMMDMGYLEANPSQDLEGHDAKHKLIILARIAIGLKIDDIDNQIFLQGLQNLKTEDVIFAASQKRVMKYIASVSSNDQVNYSLSILPTLLPSGNQIAQTNGAMNTIIVQSDLMGTLCMTASGAGSLPTGQAVASDVHRCWNSKQAISSIPPVNNKVRVDERVKIEGELLLRFAGDSIPSEISKIVSSEISTVNDCHFFKLVHDIDFHQIPRNDDRVFLMCMRT